MFRSLDLSTMPRLWGSTTDSRAFEAPSVTRKEALVAFARVAPSLNLQEEDVLLVCVLASLAGSAWRKKRRPQFESVALAAIESRTGFDSAELARRLSALEIAGIINQASDTRAGEGHVLVDMSPLASRTAQFEWMAEAEEFRTADNGENDGLDDSKALTGYFDRFDFSEPSSSGMAFASRLRRLFAAGRASGTLAARLPWMVSSFFGFWSGAPGRRCEAALVASSSEQPSGTFDFPDHDKFEETALDTILRELEAEVSASVHAPVPQEQPQGDFHFVQVDDEAKCENVSNYMERMIADACDETGDVEVKSVRADAKSSAQESVRGYRRVPPSGVSGIRRAAKSIPGKIDRLILEPQLRMSRTLTLAIRDTEIQVRLQ